MFDGANTRSCDRQTLRPHGTRYPHRRDFYKHGVPTGRVPPLYRFHKHGVPTRRWTPLITRSVNRQNSHGAAYGFQKKSISLYQTLLWVPTKFEFQATRSVSPTGSSGAKFVAQSSNVGNRPRGTKCL